MDVTRKTVMRRQGSKNAYYIIFRNIQSLRLTHCTLRLPFLLFFLLLSGCQTIYFVADPYWESVTGVSFFQLQRMALRRGLLLRLITATDDTPWATDDQNIEESIQESNDLQGSLPLKNQIEDLLTQGYTVIASPYWLRMIEEQPPKLPPDQAQQGKLILIDAISRSANITSVAADWEGGYRELGQIVGSYLQRHPERKQAIAMFYRGNSYDKYFEAFLQGFQSIYPGGERLTVERYYAAEVNEFQLSLEKLKPEENLIVLAMSQLSELAYRKLIAEEQSLFTLENFGANPDPKQQVLLSLDVDYHLLSQKAMQLARKQSDERIIWQPAVLNLPTPRLLEDIEPAKERAKQALEAKRRQEKSPGRMIAKLWDAIQEFFRGLRDIQWLSGNIRTL